MPRVFLISVNSKTFISMIFLFVLLAFGVFDFVLSVRLLEISFISHLFESLILISLRILSLWAIIKHNCIANLLNWSFLIMILTRMSLTIILSFQFHFILITSLWACQLWIRRLMVVENLIILPAVIDFMSEIVLFFELLSSFHLMSLIVNYFIIEIKMTNLLSFRVENSKVILSCCPYRIKSSLSVGI